MLTLAFLSRLRRTRAWDAARGFHRRVGPPICAVVHAAVETIGPEHLPTDLALKHRYDYEIVHVDPTKIERSVNVGEWAVIDGELVEEPIHRLRRWIALGGGWKHLQRHVSRNVHGRFVAGGDWDLVYDDFRIRPTIVDLFVNDLQPHQTDEYQKLRDWVVAKDFSWTRGCRTVADIDQYFSEMIHIFESIRRDGYRTQAELGHDGADEIRVCIDRDGRLCIFGGGTHRLSMALLLGLRSVPVIIKRVHPIWVQRHAACDGNRQLSVARGVAAL